MKIRELVILIRKSIECIESAIKTAGKLEARISKIEKRLKMDRQKLFEEE